MNLIIKNPLSVLSLCLLVSCIEAGSNKKPGPPAQIQNEIVQEDGSNINGIYAADVWPVNYNLHFKKIGKIALQRNGDEFSAHIKLDYAPKSTILRPSLYTGRRCPNLTDDLNKDAYIDILEARLAIGKVTIPFDADLDSQLGGLHQHNSSDINGKYAYHRTASFDRMFSDLKGVDQDPSDQIIKIKDEDGLTFPGRIVLFHGMDKAIDLPQTIATTDGESVHESLPVACAVLWKEDAMPGEFAQ